jgi:hypothetical protein
MINQLIKHLPNIPVEDITEFYEERAGVREFDGGYPRAEAERLAFQDTINHYSLTNHILNATTI